MSGENCTRAQRKVNLCGPGAPKGPKVRMVVRQYDILCANDAGLAPRKYPVLVELCCYDWISGGCGDLSWVPHVLWGNSRQASGGDRLRADIENCAPTSTTHLLFQRNSLWSLDRSRFVIRTP